MSRSHAGGRGPLRDTKAEVARRRKYEASRERTRLRRDAKADPVCDCGWITSMTTCPMCGGVRTQHAEG